jgi:hypothetical protein
VKKNLTQRRTNTKNIHIPFIILLFGLTFLIFINTSSAAASAVDNIIYVNGTSGNDTWDGQSAIWNGTSGPKLTIKNATDTVNTGEPSTLQKVPTVDQETPT